MPANYQRKILSLDTLLAELANARRQARTIVQCHGCFDVVHPGHVRHLQFARQQGDVLVVTLTGDSQIDKGPERPFIPQELRAENLAAMELVDYVHVDPHPAACQALQAIRPDVYVKGSEYEHLQDPRFLREKRIVESYGGRVIFSSGDVVFSSTRLLEGLPGGRQLRQQGLACVCQRHGIDAARLSELLSRLQGKRILVLGDLTVERYTACDAAELASDAPMMTLFQQQQTDWLGGAAAVAQQLKALGAEPWLVAVVGKDALGERVRQRLREVGIRACLQTARPRTVLRTLFLVEDQKLFAVERHGRHPLDSVVERAVARQVLRLLGECDGAVIFDAGLGAVTVGLMRRVRGALRRRVSVVTGSVDGRRGYLRAVAKANLLFVSERQLRSALHDYDRGLSVVAHEVLGHTQAQRTIVDLGKGGFVVFERQTDDPHDPRWGSRLRSEQLPMLGDVVVDRLGCGEAFLAATTAGLVAEANLMQAAYLGAALAGLEGMQLGSAPVSADDLRRFVSNRPELSGAQAASVLAPAAASV